MAKNKKATRVFGTTNERAVELHAEANKSDPFAARRMEMTLRRGLDNRGKVAEEALRQINVRSKRINEEFQVWKRSAARRRLFKQMFPVERAA